MFHDTVARAEDCRAMDGEVPLHFAPLTAENAPLLKPYLLASPYATCDYVLGAIFQWRAFFKTEYALVHDMLILLTRHREGALRYTYPVGTGDMDKALTAIELDAQYRGVPLIYNLVPEDGVESLRARYGERIIVDTNRDWADYLYLAEGLKTFSGKKYHGQKNHLNRFKREHPSYRFCPITPENHEKAMVFLRDYAAATIATGDLELSELEHGIDLLENCFRLDQLAGYLEVDGEIIALSIGEIVQDTLYVHVEKALTRYHGAYQAIVSEFAKYACRPDTLYINREDDSGDEGLRTSKLAYQPIRLIDKYWVTVK